MTAPANLRALLRAALGCAPLLGLLAAPHAAVAQEPCVAGSFGAPPPTARFTPPEGTVLLAAAAPAASGAGGPPPSSAEPLQKLRSGHVQFNGPITTSSDRLSLQRSGVLQLSGNVDLHMGDRQMQADQLTYDRRTNDISVSGRVHYQDPLVRVTGDSGHYGNDGGQFSNAQFQFLTHPGRGQAQSIAMTPDNVVTLRGVYYTSCPPPRADWDIRARELSLDTPDSVGIARGARVDFQGIPIVYLPYLSFPLSGARRSGLLFPDFGTSSRNGVTLGVPWYWNIAPNQDATFTPTVYTARGVALDAEYRFLSRNDTGTFEGAYLPHDSRYGSDRASARLIDQLELGGNTRLQADLESVSDNEYLEDFTQGVQSTSTAFLPRSLAIMHRDDVWRVALGTLGYQTVDNTLPLYLRPYVEAPHLSADALWTPREHPWLSFSFNGEAVNFSRAACLLAACRTLDELAGGLAVPPPALPAAPLLPSAAPGQALLSPALLAAQFPSGVNVSGWRLDAEPQVGLDLSGPGYFLRPTLAWQFTQYLLRDLAPASDLAHDPSRSLPILTLDSGLSFERLAGQDDSRSVTLEPRVMYVYIPYRDQSQLPVFDSDVPDPNLVQLFRPNRYVGIDRIGDANEVTVGLTTEMFSTASGTRYLAATLGQSFYLQPPRVSLPGQGASMLGTSTSSLIGELDVAAYRNWNVMLQIASNAAVTRILQAQAQLQYRITGNRVVNVGYQYSEGLFRQIDTSAAWPILAHWDLYARAVYSLMGHSSIENFAGFQYRGSCWGIRAVWQSSLATRTGARDTGVSVQLELNGLSNVGSETDTFLRQSIRGYSAALGEPITPAERQAASADTLAALIAP